MPPFPRRLAAVAIASLAALAGVELALRALGSPRRYAVWTPGLEQVLRPDPELTSGVSGPSLFRVSSLGFRASERPGQVELSVLALGGSTTECLYLDQAEAWPALLEAELGARLGRVVWVANAGKSGRTTRDHVLQLERLLAQRPRFERVLLLTGVNDLCAWLGASGPAALDEDERLARAFDVVPRASVPGPWWRRTAIFQLLERVHERWRAAPLAQDGAARVYARWRAHRRGAGRWRTELPDARAVLAAFRADLAAIAGLCERSGAALALVTQPALWRADLPPELEARLWMGGVGEFQRQSGCDYYTAGALARALALFNAELADSARALGVPVLDLAGALDGDPDCFYDDVHFNEQGARRVAAFLAAELAALERD